MINISFAVLSGGMSRRFNSDKTLAELDGKKLYQYSLDTALTVTDDVLHISRDKNKYTPFFEGVRFLEDEYSEQCPLAGILTAFRNMRYEKLFVLSADAPLIDKLICEKIIVESAGFDITIPQINNKLYPLTAVYDKKLFTPFLDRYQKKEYKIVDAFDSFNINIIDEKILSKLGINIKKFININNIEDFAEAKLLASHL